MKFVVFGGDDRMVRLCRMLREDGHRVSPYALEKALPCPPPEIEDADCFVLPLPAEKGGALNAPFSEKTHAPAELLSSAAAGTTVLAGMAGESLKKLCREKGLILKDYFAMEELGVKNAALTAEGAAELMLKASPRALAGARVLICGFGRIGRLLAMKLAALGARLSVCARSGSDLAWAEAMGCEALHIKSLHSCGSFDFVVNTIPSTVFGEAELKQFGEAELLELASAPYGFDTAAAKRLGKSIVCAPGLPARCAPESAARAIKETIYAILEE